MYDIENDQSNRLERETLVDSIEFYIKNDKLEDAEKLIVSGFEKFNYDIEEELKSLIIAYCKKSNDSTNTKNFIFRLCDGCKMYKGVVQDIVNIFSACYYPLDPSCYEEYDFLKAVSGENIVGINECNSIIFELCEKYKNDEKIILEIISGFGMTFISSFCYDELIYEAKYTEYLFKLLKTFNVDIESFIFEIFKQTQENNLVSSSEAVFYFIEFCVEHKKPLQFVTNNIIKVCEEDYDFIDEYLIRPLLEEKRYLKEAKEIITVLYNKYKNNNKVLDTSFKYLMEDYLIIAEENYKVVYRDSNITVVSNMKQKEFFKSALRYFIYRKEALNLIEARLNRIQQQENKARELELIEGARLNRIQQQENKARELKELQERLTELKNKAQFIVKIENKAEYNTLTKTNELLEKTNELFK